MNHRLLFTLIIMAWIIQSAMAQPGSQWRGPNRDGIYNSHNLLEEWPENGLVLIWEYGDLGVGYSSAAVTDDKVYISGTVDSISYLFALDHEGGLIWKKELGPEFVESFPGIRSTPLICDKYGYILDGLGLLYCFDTDDGSIAWTKNLQEEFLPLKTRFGSCENLLVNDDVIYCTPGGKEYNVVAMNRFNGQLIWKCQGNGEKNAYCSPILIHHHGKSYLITLTVKSVIAIDVEKGELAWKYPLRGEKSDIRANTPIYKNDRLFVSEGFEVGCIMLEIADDGKSAELVWHNDLMDETNGHMVAMGGNIYGAAETKKLFLCVDWDTGEVNYSIRKFSPGTVIAADDHLYCYSYMGELGLMMPADTAFVVKGAFKLHKEKELHIVHPVIHKKRLYVRYGNTLKVFNVAPEKV